MMKMSKLSNQTNSQDPQAVNSRVFVGNLNTFQCSKTDVERMFQKYGRLAGISMHKGYAFVQFTNPFDARNACHGEDGRTILSQVLDVNMVAEPKPHQIGRKRQNITKTGNDWDYYYDSYCASTLFSATSPRPIKRQRLMTPQARGNLVVNNKVNSPQQQIILPTSSLLNGNSLQNGMNASNAGVVVNGVNTCGGEQISSLYHVNGQPNFLGPFKVYSNPDTLICGNCREYFADLSELLEHKRSYCKLRFTCKCQENIPKTTLSTPTTKLLCAICKDYFTSPWDLMVHVQAAHMINIYELGLDASTNIQHNNNNNHNVSNNNNNTSISSSSSIIANAIAVDEPAINKVNGNVGGEKVAEPEPVPDCSDESDNVSVNSQIVASAVANCVTEVQSASSPSSYNVSSASTMLPVAEIKCGDSVSPTSSPSISPRSTELISPTPPATQSCIMRALTIETAPSSGSSTSSLGIIATPLSIAVGSGTITSQ